MCILCYLDFWIFLSFSISRLIIGIIYLPFSLAFLDMSKDKFIEIILYVEKLIDWQYTINVTLKK